MKISARNCLKGTIIAIKEGPVTTEVTIETEAKEKSFPRSPRLLLRAWALKSAAKLTP